jgi:glycosyltransferase involved in cell wall biosynthesis
VLSSNAGGIPEVNIHGETGFMSNVGDVEDMAHHAITLLSDDDMLLRFRKQALAQAQRFDLEKVILEYTDFYEETVLRKKVLV